MSVRYALVTTRGIGYSGFPFPPFHSTRLRSLRGVLRKGLLVMSITSRDPLRVAGANVSSGNVNTGEQMTTQGGGQRFASFSGGIRNLSSGGPPPVAGAPAVTADHAVIYSGAGRLNSIFSHQSVLALSGVAITFYDSATVARSGPSTWQESGYGIVGVLNSPQGASGQFTGVAPVNFGVPFNSGLSICYPSGTAGFTVTFTPESNYQNLR